MENSRNDFWDVLKGLGIIAVVIGHSGSFLTPYVYMYHIMLFFYIAGFLYNDKYSTDPYLFIGKRIQSLWILAVKYSILYTLLHNIFISIGVYSADTGSFDFNNTLGGIYNSIFLYGFEWMGGALWFVPFLFFSIVAFCFFRWSMLFIKNDLKREIIISSVLLCLIYISIFLIGKNVYYNYHFHLIFIALPIMQLAFIVKKYNLVVTYKWYIALISAATMFAIYRYTKQRLDVSQSFIINIYIFYLATFAGIYLNLYIASIILYSKYITKVFAFWGKNSFHIMALHFICFKTVDYVNYIVFKAPFTAIASFPISNEDYWIYYTLCGLVLSSLIILLAGKIKQKINLNNLKSNIIKRLQ